MSDTHKEETKPKFKGAALQFFNENPELLQNLQQRVGQRAPKLKDLKERMSFLGEQMKLLKSQAELYTAVGGTPPPDLIQQVSGLHQQISRVGAEYEKEFTNANPLTLPDPGDVPVNLDGEEVFVNQDMVQRALSGDGTIMKQIDELQSSDDPESAKEARALAQAIGEQMYSQEEEQTRFKDNGEMGIDQTSTPVDIGPVQTAPAQQDVAQKNGGMVEMIKKSLFRGATSPAAAVSEMSGALNSNLKKGKP